MPIDPQEFKRKYKWHMAPTDKPPSMVSNSSEPPPDFVNKCHYTLQHYKCDHKTWLNKPRIHHVWPYCLLSQHCFSGMDKADEQKFNHHKTRCTNMATKPMEVKMKEVCAKCRPFELGAVNTKKDLREHERLVGAEEQAFFGIVSDEGVSVEMTEEKAAASNVEKSDRKDESSKSLDEKENKEDDIDRDAEGNAQTKPGEVKEQEQLWETVREWPAKENDSNDKTPKPPATRSIFGSFFNAFMHDGKEDKTKVDDDDEQIEIWTEVDEDPDWDKIDSKETKKRKLWKNSGEWVKVNAK
ncbi:hypothetical protein EG329_002189 [Mollisiaceae sp. DMI_Dod_QoI]|nr:hypothetical protein EG329_002189 [Helotiales sp. DMI_Dod_QoI]